MNNIENRLLKNKIELLKDFPFWGILALHFNYIIDSEVKTASTDGYNINLNPGWMSKLTNAEFKWVIAHEVCHVALKHLNRQTGKDFALWNVACDYAVHSILMEFESTGFKMPEGCLYNQCFASCTAEEIYDSIKNTFQLSHDCLLDSHSAWKPINPNEWDYRLISAAKTAVKRNDKTPRFINELLSRIKPAQKDWKHLLRDYLIPDTYDYSFAPPDRRYSDMDIIMPGFNDESDMLTNIAFFVDVSSSMSDRQIVEVYSEVVGILRQFPVLKGYLGYFSSDVISFKEIETVIDVLSHTSFGYGGTDFCNPFIYLKKHHPDINKVIIFTDGLAKFPPETVTDSEVIWLFNNEHREIKAPWGLSINYKENILCTK